jgi:pilus assembly protein FimV
MPLAPVRKICRTVILLSTVLGNWGVARSLDQPLHASVHSLDGAHAGPLQPLQPDSAPGAEIRRVQAQMKNLRTETTLLRSETMRLQQQTLSYQNALQSMHDESMRWIIGLAGALAAGFAGFGLLLWRINAIKPDKRDSATTQKNRKTGPPQPLAAPNLAEEPQTPAFADPHRGEASVRQSLVDAAPVVHAKAFAPDRVNPAATAAPANTGRQLTEPEHQPKADETSEMMKLVDAWMALNAPDKMPELLQPFNEVRQLASPLPWLCLLDVYRALGDQQKYETVLARIKALFNVKLAPWDAQSSRQPPKTLADFPHIIDEILGLWQSAGVVPYLKSLLRDDRNGTRHGFDLPVYRDILQLIALATDPDRPATRGKTMPQQASAILFGTC